MTDRTLVCPNCQGKLREGAGGFECEKCGFKLAARLAADTEPPAPGDPPAPGEPGFDPYRMGFYFNPADPRLWLPKRNPALGWTINFAHPWSLPVLALLVILPVAGITWAIQLAQSGPGHK